MTVPVWSLRVTVAGEVISGVESFHADFSRDSPIGTGTLTLGLPLPAAITDAATVTVDYYVDGAFFFTAFTGYVLVPSETFDLDGPSATLPIVGNLWPASFALETDVAFTGGAKATALSLSLGSAGTYLHLGTQTVSWYADTSPDATTFDATFTPAVDSSFLWLAGRAHGTNSYDASIGDKTIKQHTKVRIRQGGVELGKAFFPVLDEQWSSMLDYTNDANWSDFELFIACNPAIDSAGGDVTVRFEAGRKPGTTDYDECEIKAVTYQTAGKTSVRNIIRGMLAYCGVTSYRCNEITDLSGATMYLGGNGLVDHGQVRVGGLEQPIAFINRIAGLFGFALVDGPDGIPRCLPYRGVPSGTSAATFTEGTSTFSQTVIRDADNVYNAVSVVGASGADPDRKPFAYTAATSSPVANALIPGAGVRTYAVNEQLLTSTALCQKVRDIQEELHDSALSSVEWEAEPVSLHCGQTVTVSAPTIGVAGDLFLIGLGYDWDDSGPNMRCVGWTGSASTISETDDPSPSETDTQPGTPRPSSEWSAYVQSSAYSWTPT